MIRLSNDCPGKYTLIGVVSYGSGCAHTTPGIYARVQGFLPWIKNLIADGKTFIRPLCLLFFYMGTHISKVSVEAATATATAAEQVLLKAAQSSRTTIPTTIRSTRSCFFHLRSTRDLWQKTYFLKDKTYDISVAAGKTIKMTFAAFSLENAYRCGWDYLMVFHHCWFWSILTLTSMLIVV